MTTEYKTVTLTIHPDDEGLLRRYALELRQARMARDCICCGKRFTPKHATAKYCSKTCRNYFSLHKKTREPSPERKACAFCGKRFRVKSHSAKYCSDACRKHNRAAAT